ncbi:small subunit ribosomal protein S16 [Balneicella halophila]|uniref:Small ribosomal subunit protein bS16 n=1 Tax=Balneicella halophila TaxID=1537566 RepID=A0A7L4UND1_BALHA|nr:30S ribosomal protein S16 [Balneicella halophila]PVX50690.1 small subunit ribosomal protein S16 [Balneicella halophila]
MPTKIRLARHGRKGYPFYSIVIADSRAPRDGRYIEKIGTYNPNTNPATIDLKFERALYWLQEGAQPTDTARTLLSTEGVLMKKHLLDGVKKGAFDEETADKKFDAWFADKRSKLQAQKDKLSKETEAETKKRLEAEAEANKAKAEAIAKKKAEELEAEKAAKAEAAAEAEAKEAEESATEDSAEATEEEAPKAE